ELLAIDGVLDILHPAQQSWHSKNNHDGALHVKAFCTVFAGKISRDIVKCKKGLRDIIAERREFNAALVSNVDASVHIEVSELTKMSNRLSNEQRDLYPDPELGGSFTPTFNMLQECLDTAVDTVPMLAALQTLNISSTPAAIAEAEATAKIEEDEAFTVAARNKLS
ncbi:MAG: hypothetical protein HOI53_00075, partial [Francisellaceae bacterium]|nr:hypothetical protein [Francisellaceae bacterium]